MLEHTLSLGKRPIFSIKQKRKDVSDREVDIGEIGLDWHGERVRTRSPLLGMLAVFLLCCSKDTPS